MPAQGELRGTARHGGGDWDSHPSDLEDAWLNPPDNAELAEYRKRLHARNRATHERFATPPPRPSWDRWAMGIAWAIAKRADCSRKQVGAVILDRAHRVAAAGYNGAPPAITGCLEGGCPRATSGCEPGSNYDNCISNHAEVNALLYADRSRIEGGTLYVTYAPCTTCHKIIANSGLSRVVWPGGSKEL